MNIPYPPEHYYQNQGMVPKTGPVECVTTSVVMVMNMVKDRLARDLNRPAIPDIGVREYVEKLDAMGLSGLFYRLPSDFFLRAGRGWMHPVLQAPRALSRFADELTKEYGYSFKVKQTAGNSLVDIMQALQDGNFVIVHGLWEAKDQKEVHHTFGGWPHSMVAVGVDRQADKVLLLNPAEPDPGTIDPDDPATFPAAGVSGMPMEEFLAFWGRKSILNLYTRPNTMTTVIPETMGTVSKEENNQRYPYGYDVNGDEQGFRKKTGGHEEGGQDWADMKRGTGLGGRPLRAGTPFGTGCPTPPKSPESTRGRRGQEVRPAKSAGQVGRPIPLNRGLANRVPYTPKEPRKYAGQAGAGSP